MRELISWFSGLVTTIPLRVIVAVAIVILAQRATARLGMWPYALFALPGTLAHELSHFIVAKLLWAKPQFPRLWPERTDHGWRLGSVQFHAPWWRAAPIAVAPIALLPASLWWMAGPAAEARGAMLALHAWIAGTLLSASLPSRADLRLALPTFLVATVVGFAWVALSTR